MTGQLNVDNLRMDGNTLSATSGGITISPAANQSLALGGLVSATEFQATLGEFTTLRSDNLSTDTSNADLTIGTQGTGLIDITTPTQMTVGAVGAATHLPLDSANEIRPVGYLRIKISGTEYVIPYFNAS